MKRGGCTASTSAGAPPLVFGEGSATVTIDGDGAAASGSLQLSAANYPVAQNAGKVTVTVDRANGSNGAGDWYGRRAAGES